jgi:hypothetical protein
VAYWGSTATGAGLTTCRMLFHASQPVKGTHASTRI